MEPNSSVRGAASPVTFQPSDNLPSSQGQPSLPVHQSNTEAVRATAEVQAMMTIAKRCPRDETAAIARILQACKRPSLAKGALYAFRRGTQTVTGPSIRLLEVIAKNWGNISWGVEEVSQEAGQSNMIAFAWDLETNFKDVKKFVAKHERDLSGGQKKILTDGRDIYEVGANLGARRKRACLEAVIPADVIDEARRACEATISGDGKEPLIDRVRRMVAAFQELGVTTDMIVEMLGHKIEVTIPAEFVRLHQIYASIQDGHAKREDFFKVGAERPATEAASALDSKLGGKAKA